MNNNLSPINVAIISDYQGKYSEGFIKAHINCLATCLIPAHRLLWKKNHHFAEALGLPGKIKMRLKRLIQSNVINRIEQRKVLRILRAHNIDVVLAEYGHVGIIAHELLKEAKIPLVVHFHGIDAYKKILLKQRKQAYQEMFSYSRGIIAVSQDMRQQLIGLGASAEKVFYNTYGVDVNRFIQTTPSSSGPHLLAVGRFVDKKAPYLTILAFQKVLREVPEAQLTMLGDGPLLGVCINIVKSLQIEQSVHLPGAVDHDQVASLMQKTRAFVQHSIVALSGDSEGTPNTILEAGASGIPVVSTKHAGIKDVIEHDKTGFLVEEGDIEGMAHYIVQLLRDNALADRMGQAAYAYIRENHRLDQSLDRLRGILLQGTGANKLCP